jgi:hypothetical protein
MMRYTEIEPHLGWELFHDEYEDGDRFPRYWWEAHKDGGHKLLQVSDFNFTMTQARFNWLVENDFPHHYVQHSHGPVGVPWSNDAIDERIANAAAS